MDDDELSRIERGLIETIERIRGEYLKATEPYLRRLAQLRALRPPAPTLLQYEVMRPAPHRD